MSILQYLIESDNVNFQQSKNGNYIGYKVMTVSDDGRNFVSGANKRLNLPVAVGSVHVMPGNGIYIANNPDYAVDYYSYKESEDDPNEMVIQYEFSLDDVVDGSEQLGDSEPEIGVSKAKVIGLVPIDDWKEDKKFEIEGEKKYYMANPGNFGY